MRRTRSCRRAKALSRKEATNAVCSAVRASAALRHNLIARPISCPVQRAAPDPVAPLNQTPCTRRRGRARPILTPLRSAVAKVRRRRALYWGVPCRFACWSQSQEELTRAQAPARCRHRSCRRSWHRSNGSFRLGPSQVARPRHRLRLRQRRSRDRPQLSRSRLRRQQRLVPPRARSVRRCVCAVLECR